MPFTINMRYDDIWNYNFSRKTVNINVKENLELHCVKDFYRMNIKPNMNYSFTPCQMRGYCALLLSARCRCS